MIEPKIKSGVRLDKNLFEYRFRIANGRDAQQAISDVSVTAPKWDISTPQRQGPIPGESGVQALTRVRAGQVSQDEFIAKTLYSPARWKPFLNVKIPTRVVFGWLVKHDKTYGGVAPRSAQAGFSVLRSELPGAGWVELQGDTPDFYEAATLPRTGAVADQVAQVLAEDSVFVAAMVPAIVLPSPYDGAELARRIKAHVATWPESGLMEAEKFATLGPKFDELIRAAAGTDKKAVRAATVAIMTEAFTHHAGLTHRQVEGDEDEHDSKSLNLKTISPLGALTEVTEKGAPIHRVAARALVFDLMYLLRRVPQ